MLYLEWVDLVWLPISLVLVAPKHRVIAACFILACLLTLREQISLMASTGHPTGIVPWLTGPPLFRGQVTYGIIIALYLLLLHFSHKSLMPVVLAASIVIYILAFAISMVILAI
jgi:hypothetical protein